MVTVIVPIALMLCIALIKPIPKIGGSIQVALIVAGISALIMGGIYNPITWIMEWISGVDRIAWVIGLSVFGSLYAQTQSECGALATVLNALRAAFAKSPRGLIVVIIVALGIAGAFLGDSIAASTVVGVLTIGAMADLNMKPEKIAAIIIIGASMGSIMPPVTQAITLSANLIGIDPDVATRPAYLTVGLGIIFCCIFCALVYVTKDMKLPEHLIPKESAGKILAQHWKSLIALAFLAVLVLMRAIPGGSFDFIKRLLSAIPIGAESNFYTWLSGVTIIKGFSNTIVLIMLLATALTFILYKNVRENVGSIFKKGFGNIKNSATIQLCIGLMLGGFYAGGQIEKVQEFAQGLSQSALIWGCTIAMCILGMMTGSQSAPQSMIFSFAGPALLAVGFDPVRTAIWSSHVAAAGQGFPPVDLMAIMVCGLVGGMLNKKVDPVKAMIYALPFSLWLLVAGLIMIHI